ncbi:efflux RND transporter periplasmic adaptor subunit [Nostoc sp. NMS8]|uniref:efflux RND transporter periplasmic adaptor subunit n=1 Tax=Nostoc sp. NMS8 TaxID=2815392 RepID=UPI0025F8ADFF|nr:efflux RND transporter periplasmic adaptor subunit [Nostoc sp. NMS8]MBN3962488.1 efflux RND transporter periplasmic adaptor subunit [Nostoc sp. NMS8]
MQARLLLSRAILTTLVVAPLGLMGILSVRVLLPALKDPESRFYSSGFGYPALQRMAGKPIQVETVAVETKNLEDSLAAPGESVAMQQVDVRSQISGLVEKVDVEEGQWVRRGQPLLVLQKAPFEDQVNTARNNLATAEKNIQTLQSSAPGRLLDLQANLRFAEERADASQTQQKEIDNLAEQEVNNNVQAAQLRLTTAEEKLNQIKLLADQGAISRFQLYDMQDIYATRKRELLSAQQGVIDTQNKRFINKDFHLSRKNELISAQQALKLAQENLDKDLANARLTVENRRIDLQKALRDLNRTVIYASTDGLVSVVNIHSGEIADARNRDALMTLTQNIVFKAYIDQARLNAIKVGNKATVRLIAYPGRTFEGQVIQLNPTVETNSTRPGRVGIDRQYTYSAWIAVNNLQMPPGLQGYVQFMNQGKTALVIPESSVTHLSAGEGMVMVAEAGQAVVRKVKLGRIFDNQREVLEGLKPGEQVVPSARALNPGDRIEAQSAQMPIAQQR